MGKTKKLRREEKRYRIKVKRYLKAQDKYFKVSNPWPSRGCRAMHFKDDDAFENAIQNHVNTFKYPFNSEF